MSFRANLALAVGATLACASFAQTTVVDSVRYESTRTVARRAPRSATDPIRFTPPTPVTLDALDVEPLLAEDERTPPGSPQRVGIVRELVPVEARDGMWSPLDEGGWVWTADFEAPGATGIRLRVRGFDSRHSGELRVLDVDDPGEWVGPMFGMRRDQLWTPTVRAERVRVEYEVAGDELPADDQLRFVIDALVQRYDCSATGGGPCVAPMACHLDVNCYPNWLFEADAVGALYFIGGGGCFVCSAGLLNRAPHDFTPLLATANHCGVTSENVGSVEVSWFFRSSSCNGTVPSWTTRPSSAGVARLVVDAATDYTLLGLDDSLPSGATLLGWDATFWPPSSTGAAIHHPRGSHQRISFPVRGDDTLGCTATGATDCWEVWYTPDSAGNTNGNVEPGSSGSQVLDSFGRVRGTLSCGTWACGQTDLAIYGRFDKAFPRLAPYLTPADPIYARRSYSGSEQGTSAQPFNTLIEASFAVISGSTIWLSPGTFPETPTLTKPMLLRTTGGDVVIGG